MYHGRPDVSVAPWRRRTPVESITCRSAHAPMAGHDRDPEKSYLESGGRALHRMRPRRLEIDGGRPAGPRGATAQADQCLVALWAKQTCGRDRRNDAMWYIASCRGDAAVRLLPEQSGHSASRAHRAGLMSTRPNQMRTRSAALRPR